ncbi:NYN domain-containing protein [Nocardioides iriomotensis]|nr:NYN domain-containing protein [Nocardioides iriomotensis]
MTAAVEDSGDRLAGPLPEPVRQRVVALAAEALGRMPQENLPATLKRVATFAPGRRAKLAGSQIAGVIESDATFREHLARQVRTAVAAVADALEAGAPPAAADPVEVAAIAYLLRPDGWLDLVAASADAAAAEREVEVSRQSAGQVDRLRRQLEAAADELRDVRARNREEVARLKAENAELRHKLGDVRTRLRSAEVASTAAEEAATEAGRNVQAAVTAAEAETRRLRVRIEELESDLAAVRRTERTGRGAETLRARLLLDTLLDTAQGLRRELALPAVEGAPADQVEAHVAEQGSRTSTGHGSMAVDDPALLEQLLALPRVHMVVDGYNVTKTAWPELSLEKQRDRLLGALAPLVARSGAEVTVVFDAADKKERPLVNRPRGVRVLFSPVGVIADDVIRELVAAEPQGRPVVVVTTDQAVVRDVVKAGARPVASAALSRLLARS